MKKEFLRVLQKTIEKTIMISENQASAWGVYEVVRDKDVEEQIERFMQYYGRKNSK